MLFKMMKACIGVKNVEDLWIYPKDVKVMNDNGFN